MCFFTRRELDRTVGVVTHYWLDSPGFESWQGQEMLSCTKLSRQALVPTHPPIQLVQGSLPGGKVAGA